nr:hypothetical protein [bacterium]
MSATGNELGELLIDLGLVTPEELSDAVRTQQESGERLTLVLSNMGLVNERQLKDALELQYGVNFITLARTNLNYELVKSIPEEVLRKHRFIPISTGTQSSVAMVDPDDLIAADAVRSYLKSGNFKKLVCTADDFDFCLQQLYAPPVEEAESNGEVEPEPEAEPVKETKKGKSAKASKAKSKKGGVKSLFGDDEEDDDDESDDEDDNSEVEAESP